MAKLTSCMFCSDEDVPASREDVFPLWLARKLAYTASQKHPKEEPRYRSHTYDAVDDFRADIKDDKVGARALNTATSGAIPAAYKWPVCKACNEGWMSQLEQAAQRIMPGLIVGKPKRLTPYEQFILSTWATKTALVYDAATPPRAIPNEVGSRRFYRLGHPMTGVSVAIGHDPHHEPEGVLLHGRQLLGDEEHLRMLGAVAARFIFQFDCLLIQVAICIGMDILPTPLYLTDYWERILPVQERFDWPSDIARTKRDT